MIAVEYKYTQPKMVIPSSSQDKPFSIIRSASDSTYHPVTSNRVVGTKNKQPIHITPPCSRDKITMYAPPSHPLILKKCFTCSYRYVGTYIRPNPRHHQPPPILPANSTTCPASVLPTSETTTRNPVRTSFS